MRKAGVARQEPACARTGTIRLRDFASGSTAAAASFPQPSAARRPVRQSHWPTLAPLHCCVAIPLPPFLSIRGGHILAELFTALCLLRLMDDQTCDPARGCGRVWPAARPSTFPWNAGTGPLLDRH